MNQFPITITSGSPLQLSPKRGFLGAVGDDAEMEIVLIRPEGRENDDAIIRINGEKIDFGDFNIGKSNTFTVVRALTTAPELSLQVIFRKEGGEEARSDVANYRFTESLRPGVIPVEFRAPRDGEPGPPGPRGADGAAGRDGKDGRDGEPGAQGPKGADGYTPVKGVDYFDGPPGTSASITSATASALPSGSTPTVTMGGTAQERTFTFGIPKGADGGAGKSAWQSAVESGNTGGATGEAEWTELFRLMEFIPEGGSLPPAEEAIPGRLYAMDTPQEAVPGPIGPEGPPGESIVGPVGPMGPMGPTGIGSMSPLMPIKDVVQHPSDDENVLTIRLDTEYPVYRVLVTDAINTIQFQGNPGTLNELVHFYVLIEKPSGRFLTIWPFIEEWTWGNRFTFDGEQAGNYFVEVYAVGKPLPGEPQFAIHTFYGNQIMELPL